MKRLRQAPWLGVLSLSIAGAGWAQQAELANQTFEWQSAYTNRWEGSYGEYAVSLLPGSPYTFETKNATSTYKDTYLYLLNASGAIVAQDDDSAGNLLSRIIYTPTLSGTYYVRLRAYNKGSSGICTLSLPLANAEGCFDSGEVSVVTVAAGLTNWSARSRAKQLYDAHPHPDRTAYPDVRIEFESDTSLALAPEGGGGEASVGQVASEFYFIENYLGQETSHNLIAPLPVVNVISSRTMTSVGPGLLRDSGMGFTAGTTRLFAGDELTYQINASTSSTGYVLTVVDPTTITFSDSIGGPQSQVTPFQGGTYSVTSKDLWGRQESAHWNLNVDADGSWLDGNDWQDNQDPDPQGVRSFTLLTAGTRYGIYDLHIMELKPISELAAGVDDPFLFVIKNRTDVGGITRGIRRDFTIRQVFGASGLPQQPDLRANWNIRLMIITSVGKHVNQAIIEHMAEVRRDWVTLFRYQTAAPPPQPGQLGDLRGSMVAIHDQTKPDLVVSRISGVPLKANPGQILTVDAEIHNQSPVSTTSGFMLALHTLPGPSTPLTTLPVSALGGHEARTHALTFTVPAESQLFGSATYQGSFTIRVTVDSAGAITETDETHNTRTALVGWGPALGANVASTGAIQAGPVVGKWSRIYVARKLGSGSRIEEVEIGDPLAPQVITTLDLGSQVTALAANSSLLAVASIDGMIRVYSLPLDGSGPKQTASDGIPWALAISSSGTVLYVGKVQGGTDVLTGLSASGGTLSLGPNLPSNVVRKLLVGLAGSSPRLFVGADGGLKEYNIQNPASPSFVRTLSTETAWDLVSDATGTYLYANLRSRTVSIALTGASSGSIVSDWGINNVQQGLLIAGQYLLTHSQLHRWTALKIASGTLSFAGELEVGERGLGSGGNAGAALCERWSVLADGYGQRLFSPSGVTDRFVRGDANGDGAVNSSDRDKVNDAVLFGDTFAGRQDAFDANDDGRIDIADSVYLNSYVGGGPAPRPPFPSEGTDPTSDTLKYTRPR